MRSETPSNAVIGRRERADAIHKYQRVTTPLIASRFAALAAAMTGVSRLRTKNSVSLA